MVYHNKQTAYGSVDRAILGCANSFRLVSDYLAVMAKVQQAAMLMLNLEVLMVSSPVTLHTARWIRWIGCKVIGRCR